MKKLTRSLAILLALCFVLSLGAFASGDPSGDASGSPSGEGAAFAQVDDTHWAGGSITIQSVEIAADYAEYVDATQFCNVSKIVYDGGEIDVDSEAYTAILTVDGVQYDLYNAAGRTYTGDVVITLAAKGVGTNQGNSKFGDDAGSSIGTFYYTAAAYIAGALRAERLIMMTDIAGVLRDRNDPDSLISELTIAEAVKLFEDNVIAGGMIPKVECCIDAIHRGVDRVIIMDGRVPHSILMEILTDEGAGTMVYGEETELCQN